MKRIESAFMAPVLIVILWTGAAWGQTARWTEQKANAWYVQQPWLVGNVMVPKRQRSISWRCGRRQVSMEPAQARND